MYENVVLDKITYPRDEIEKALAMFPDGYVFQNIRAFLSSIDESTVECDLPFVKYNDEDNDYPSQWTVPVCVTLKNKTVMNVKSTLLRLSSGELVREFVFGNPCTITSEDRFKLIWNLDPVKLAEAEFNAVYPDPEINLIFKILKD